MLDLFLHAIVAASRTARRRVAPLAAAALALATQPLGLEPTLVAYETAHGQGREGISKRTLRGRSKRSSYFRGIRRALREVGLSAAWSLLWSPGVARRFAFPIAGGAPTATATPNSQLRDKLKEVRSGAEETRGELAEARKKRDEAKEAFAGADLSDPDVTASDEFKQAEQAVAAHGKLADRLADQEKAERTILGMLGEDHPDPSGNGPSQVRGKGRLAALTDGEAYQRLKESGAFQSRSHLGSVPLGELASREDAMAAIGVGRARAETEEEEAKVIGSDEKTGAIPADRRGIVPPALKPLTLLDLIPMGTTDSNTVEYVQITKKPEGAEETAEGEPKPRMTLESEDASAPARTIAGYVKVKKQALEDVAGLQSLIATLLPYEVRRRLEAQILAGTGEGEEIKGILKQTGIGAPEAVALDNNADAILRAITTIVLSDHDPDFVALNPVIWQALLLMRENETFEAEELKEKSGMYLYGAPGSLAAPTIWGLAITKNRVLPEAEGLVGTSMAAQILVRSGLQVLVSDNDGDDFTRNRATVLAEMRAAFPVWYPSAFAIASVTP